MRKRNAHVSFPCTGAIKRAGFNLSTTAVRQGFEATAESAACAAPADPFSRTYCIVAQSEFVENAAPHDTSSYKAKKTLKVTDGVAFLMNVLLDRAAL